MADKVLVLGFTTPSDTKTSLTINRPGRNITGAEIKAAMELIIAQNAIGKNCGSEIGYQKVSGIAYARYVTTADTEYEF